jgi:hypothetical protein
MSQRNGAPHVVMEKHQPLKNIHGKQKTLTAKEYAEITSIKSRVLYFTSVVVAFVNFDKYQRSFASG